MPSHCAPASLKSAAVDGTSLRAYTLSRSGRGLVCTSQGGWEAVVLPACDASKPALVEENWAIWAL
jgi:hypothetical protein